jgi:hypothetical protein
MKIKNIFFCHLTKITLLFHTLYSLSLHFALIFSLASLLILFNFKEDIAPMTTAVTLNTVATILLTIIIKKRWEKTNDEEKKGQQ